MEASGLISSDGGQACGCRFGEDGARQSVVDTEEGKLSFLSTVELPSRSGSGESKTENGWPRERRGLFLTAAAEEEADSKASVAAEGFRLELLRLFVSTTLSLSGE